MIRNCKQRNVFEVCNSLISFCFEMYSQFELFAKVREIKKIYEFLNDGNCHLFTVLISESEMCNIVCVHTLY